MVLGVPCRAHETLRVAGHQNSSHALQRRSTARKAMVLQSIVTVTDTGTYLQCVYRLASSLCCCQITLRSCLSCCRSRCRILCCCGPGSFRGQLGAELLYACRGSNMHDRVSNMETEGEPVLKRASHFIVLNHRECPVRSTVHAVQYGAHSTVTYIIVQDGGTESHPWHYPQIAYRV